MSFHTVSGIKSSSQRGSQGSAQVIKSGRRALDAYAPILTHHKRDSRKWRVTGFTEIGTAARGATDSQLSDRNSRSIGPGISIVIRRLLVHLRRRHGDVAGVHPETRGVVDFLLPS